MIRSILVTIITFGYILLAGFPFLMYTIISGNTDPIYRVGRLGAKMAVWLAGARLEVRGLEKIPQGRAVVFMPNHQGNCDPPALVAILPPVLIMAKKEFFRVPVLGRGMVLRGFIPVDRKNRGRAIQAVDEAVKSLKAGRSFLAYPEGTRSRDGRLQPFKRGVFAMAVQAGAPIVPISVSGSIKIMRKGDWAMHPGVVRITIHDPVPTEGLGSEDREMLMEKVRQAILSGLAEDEWPIETVANRRGGLSE
jgi:1-acyl-sn-glycerol-3-phosphate acyltransferase